MTRQNIVGTNDIEICLSPLDVTIAVERFVRSCYPDIALGYDFRTSPVCNVATVTVSPKRGMIQDERFIASRERLIGLSIDGKVWELWDGDLFAGLEAHSKGGEVICVFADQDGMPGVRCGSISPPYDRKLERRQYIAEGSEHGSN